MWGSQKVSLKYGSAVAIFDTNTLLFDSVSAPWMVFQFATNGIGECEEQKRFGFFIPSSKFNCIFHNTNILVNT